MLTHIKIQNFTIIDHIDIDLNSGMTVLTGETGAGKSILIDALALTLGSRADNKIVRQGTQRCDISATYNINKLKVAQNWLTTQELNSEDNDCILRRVINNDGPSRCFINGQPVTLQQLREIGDLLVDIHGQHEHQSLLKRDAQRILLDEYAGHGNLLQQITTIYQQWKNTQQVYTDLFNRTKDQTTRSEFLRYQIQELTELNITHDELTHLDHEHKQLANVGELTVNCQLALNILDENDSANVLNLLKQAQSALLPMKNFDEKIATCIDLIDSSIIQSQEAAIELRHYVDKLELNPQRLKEIEQRFSDIHDIARKHRVQPKELPGLLEQFNQELSQLDNSDQYLHTLAEQIKTLEKDYHEVATELSQSRKKTAKKLSQLVEKSMQQLGMPGGKFDIIFDNNKEDQLSPAGLEKVEFFVSANPGQALQPLAKVASGGELSRISLAIQVITAQSNVTPTLIFDEVDVGIGGGTAEIVGKLLRQLGTNAQVLCVTHLPQVAAQGHQHFHVNKSTEKNQTKTQIQLLTAEEKIHEIARMLGGTKITQQTLAHAKEMVELT